MNIFITDPSPAKCAQYLDNKRVVKMCLETAQILSTALRHWGCSDPRLYKSTHINHPVVKWARTNRANFLWTFKHLVALCSEYKKRYGKDHKCSTMLDAILVYKNILPNGVRTPFANCARNKGLKIDYTMLDDVFTAYQLYLNDRWETDKNSPKWG